MCYFSNGVQHPASHKAFLVRQNISDGCQLCLIRDTLIHVCIAIIKEHAYRLRVINSRNQRIQLVDPILAQSFYT